MMRLQISVSLAALIAGAACDPEPSPIGVGKVSLLYRDDPVRSSKVDHVALSASLAPERWPGECFRVSEDARALLNGSQMTVVTLGMDFPAAGWSCLLPTFGLSWPRVELIGAADALFEVSDREFMASVRATNLLQRREPEWLPVDLKQLSRGQRLALRWPATMDLIEYAEVETYRTQGVLAGPEQAQVNGQLIEFVIPNDARLGTSALRILVQFTVPIASCEGVPSCTLRGDVSRSYDVTIVR